MVVIRQKKKSRMESIGHQHNVLYERDGKIKTTKFGGISGMMLSNQYVGMPKAEPKYRHTTVKKRGGRTIISRRKRQNY